MIDHRISAAKDLIFAMPTDGDQDVIGVERLKYYAKAIDDETEDVRYKLRQSAEFILISMESREASDLEMGGKGSNGMVWYRTHGKKKPEPEMGSFTQKEMDILLVNLLMPYQRDELWEKRQLHYSYQLMSPPGPLRFRMTMYVEMDSLALSVRLIHTEVRPFRSLGLLPAAARLMSMEYEKRGLILITGISGSGKSTTLDTVVDANNRTANSHIVMISDPIEHIHVSQKCLIRQREIGSDVLTYRDGVAQSLRQDPDMIVISEMRDADTFAAVLEAADSGHKVFATLHTSSAIESIDRILGETPPMEQQRIRERLATLLTCVLSQRLIPGADGRLVLAKEVMVTNGAIRSLIRNNNAHEIYHIIMQGAAEGMITMEQDLANLHRTGRITMEEAMNNANNKRRLEEILFHEDNIS